MPPAMHAAPISCTQVVLSRLGPGAPPQAPAGVAEQPALSAPSFVPPPVREPAATKLDTPVPQPEAAPVQQAAPGVRCSYLAHGAEHFSSNTPPCISSCLAVKWLAGVLELQRSRQSSTSMSLISSSSAEALIETHWPGMLARCPFSYCYNLYACQIAQGLHNRLQWNSSRGAARHTCLADFADSCMSCAAPAMTFARVLPAHTLEQYLHRQSPVYAFGDSLPSCTGSAVPTATALPAEAPSPVQLPIGLEARPTTRQVRPVHPSETQS